MSDRIAEIRTRLNAATPGPWSRDPVLVYLGDDRGDHRVRSYPGLPTVAVSEQAADADLIAHAPADIAWLLEQYEWMSKERDKVIDWLSDGYGNRVEVEEVLFQFGVINGHLEDGTPWTGTCSCNAKLREECYCGYEWKFADE